MLRGELVEAFARDDVDALPLDAALALSAAFIRIVNPHRNPYRRP